MFDSSKLWHRLRGHRITTKPFDPNVGNLFDASRVIDECTCGDRWVFNALIFRQTFVPKGALP